MIRPPDSKAKGFLSRTGENAAFAGFTRLTIAAGTVLLTVLGYLASLEFERVLQDIHDTQGQVIVLSNTIARLEERSVDTTAGFHKFEDWATTQIGSLALHTNNIADQVNKLQYEAFSTTSRVHCLEIGHKCPP